MLTLFVMFAIEYIEIELYSIFIGCVMFEHGDEIDPLRVDDGIVYFLFEDGCVELVEILD